MNRLVIDTSVVIAWLLAEESYTTLFERTVRDAVLVAPWLLRLEIVNAALKKERQKMATQAQSSRFFELVGTLNIEVAAEPATRSLEQLAALARPHQLSAYDTVYLELAMTLNVPLFTHDTNLRAAATRLGVKTIG